MASAYSSSETFNKTIQVRFSEELLSKIDTWGLQVRKRSRSEAVRDLIEMGLEKADLAKK